MARIRLFVEAELAPGATVMLDPLRAHYVANVMRARAGDALTLFNGRDGAFRADVVSVARNAVQLGVAARTASQPRPASLELVVAALKRDAMDLVAQKATELGVGAIRPVFTARTVAARVGTERLRAIATEAAEQCGRCDIPDIHPAQPLATLLDSWPANRRLLVADESGASPPIGDALDHHAGPWSVLIGPEGGLTGAELDGLRVRAFVTAAGLGPRILRADTAAIAALAVVQAFTGDWR
jgi:16S rRNA (uracil1498-N3)-methyltransferase